MSFSKEKTIAREKVLVIVKGKDDLTSPEEADSLVVEPSVASVVDPSAFLVVGLIVVSSSFSFVSESSFSFRFSRRSAAHVTSSISNSSFSATSG